VCYTQYYICRAIRGVSIFTLLCVCLFVCGLISVLNNIFCTSLMARAGAKANLCYLYIVMMYVFVYYISIGCNIVILCCIIRNSNTTQCLPDFVTTPHSGIVAAHFPELSQPLLQSIESLIMDGFWHSRCLNDRIDLLYMIGSFASGAHVSLVAKNGTKKIIPLLWIKPSKKPQIKKIHKTDPPIKGILIQNTI